MLELVDELVAGTATSGGGGSAPAVIEELNVTPSTSAQTIIAPEGVDGYSPVNVSAVTSSIDANITAENIKSGVDILGVTGNLEGADIITALNNTGTAVSEGDKVWIDEVSGSYQAMDFISARNTININKNGTLEISTIADKFSASNYLSLVNKTISDLDIGNCTTYLKIKMGNDVNSSQIILSVDPLIVYMHLYQGYVKVYNAATQANIDLFHVNTNAYYWIKIETINGTTRKISISTDGQTYSTPVTYTENSISGNFFSLFSIGNEPNGTAYFRGCVDLDECYIKNADGKVVWQALNKGILTGVAKENIASGSTGQVSTVLPPAPASKKKD